MATLVVTITLKDDDPDLKRESAVLRRIRNDPNVSSVKLRR
jgi:hypothetical protein